jgi:hypothetical protein
LTVREIQAPSIGIPTAIAFARHHSRRLEFPSQFFVPGRRPDGIVQSSFPVSSVVQGMSVYAGWFTIA